MAVRGAAVLASAISLIFGSSTAQPNLVESSVSVTQHAATLRVADVVRNVGAATAAQSITGYYLDGVRVGHRRVSRLHPGGVSRGTVAVTIPASVRTGAYRLRACADDPSRLRESHERDNCRASAQIVRVTDRTPPVFAGLKAATTCLPGPAGGGTRSSSYHLRWSPATDNVTPSASIVYDVFQGTTAGAENLASPTYTTPPGAEAFSTPPLPDDKAHYFIVRARDADGNRDANTVEKTGMNLCL